MCKIVIMSVKFRVKNESNTPDFACGLHFAQLSLISEGWVSRCKGYKTQIAPLDFSNSAI